MMETRNEGAWTNYGEPFTVSGSRRRRFGRQFFYFYFYFLDHSPYRPLHMELA
jgi:hypothetical protein